MRHDKPTPSQVILEQMLLRMDPAFTPERSHIEYWYEGDDIDRHVRTSLLISDYPPPFVHGPCHPTHQAFLKAQREQAEILWQSKYSEDLPATADLGYFWPHSTHASDIDYDGATALTDVEQEFVHSRLKGGGGYTIEVLWLLVEGLGWRPGRPVSEDDPGWISIWACEERSAGFYNIVRDMLGMPVIEELDECEPWKPQVVIDLEASANSRVEPCRR